jgi:hypothetical protein
LFIGATSAIINFPRTKYKSRGLIMSGYDFDKYFPLQGTCFHCGRDLRHHTIEKITERFASGESVNKLAADYDVPPQAIELALARNSTYPLGRTITPMVRARAA